MDVSKPLDFLKHEEFAQRVVACGNQSQAYREVFQPDAATPSRTVWSEACRMANRIDVGRRIEWLRGASLDRAQLHVAGMMQDLHDIATADPSELVRTITGNCRQCHGVRFKYRWADAEEFADAVAIAERGNARLPTCDGGFGFQALDEPHPMCPHCLGVGVRQTWVADTTTLSERARKLWTGHLDKYGRPILHDKLQARDQLHKLAGAYKTDSNGASLTPPIAQPDAAGKAVDASVTYLAMVRGSKTG